VDGEEVRAMEGDFYGGWITSRVVGPFKGGAGHRVVVTSRRGRPERSASLPSPVRRPPEASVRRRDVSVVKINVLQVPEGRGEVLEQRFAARAGEVEKVDGFESFELLRPTEGFDRYLVSPAGGTRSPSRAG
jgi:hypothetical protein